MDVVLFVHFPAVLASVCLAIRYLFPVARRYRFVDMPDTRKRHRRPTPLADVPARLYCFGMADASAYEKPSN